MSVDRVQRFYTVGPWAEYTDFGQIGAVTPLRWETSGLATQTGVVEVSFQYRTRGRGPFVVTFTVREVGGPGTTIRPGAFTIAPASKRAVTSVRFVVPQLSSGHTYEGEVGVNSVPPDGGVGINKITTSKAVVTVELTDS